MTTRTTLFVGSLSMVALLGCWSTGFEKAGGRNSDPGQAGVAVDPSNEGDGGATSAEPTGTAGDATAEPCSADPECDDGAPCNGKETCSDGTCLAGEALSCEMGMECSDTPGGRCIFTDESPWIIYMADDDTPGVPELYATKRNMSPIKLNRELEPGWAVAGGSGWSLDRTVYAFHVSNEASGQRALQVVHLGAGLPDEAQQVEGTSIQWAPSGLTFAVTQATGLFIYEYSGDGRFEQVFSTVDAGTENTFGAWTPAGEFVYSRTDTATQKSSIRKVQRGLTNWGVLSVVEELDAMRGFRLSRDGTELVYELRADGETRAPLFVMHLLEGSEPKELAPEGEHSYDWSRDGQRFLLRKQRTEGGLGYFLGTRAMDTARHVHLVPSLPLESAYFTSDSKQVVLVLPLGTWGKDYYLLDPAVTTQYADAPLGRSGSRDGGPRFAPDHDTVVMPTREVEGANIDLTLFSLSGRRSKATIDSIFPGNRYHHHLEFSGRAQFVVYGRGDNPNYEGMYVDLRDSTGSAPKPVPLPGDGSFYEADFGGSDSDLYYVLEQPDGVRGCFYLDLASQVAKEPVKLSRAGRVDYCMVQPAP